MLYSQAAAGAVHFPVGLWWNLVACRSMGNVSAARAKAKGNAAFQAQNYEESVLHFTEGIQHNPSDIVLYSNRSASYVHLDDYTNALKDGEKCVSLNPEWARGYARKGLAEFHLCQYDKAAATYKAGLDLAPSDPLLVEGLKEVKNAKKSPFQRGMTVIGWQGKAFEVPFVIANSRVTNVLQNPLWPAEWPYTEADFKREDERNDARFYSQSRFVTLHREDDCDDSQFCSRPRFVTHIDDGAISAIRRFYALQFAQASQGQYAVLDICSSWTSHYPVTLTAERVAVIGLNEEELQANKQATEHVAKDLNKDPALPFGNREFDFVTIAVSVDYLTRPREVFREMHRVMKPGGVAMVSFSNRCFPEKTIGMWVQNMDDGPGHCQIVGNYFHFNPEGGWDHISSIDLSEDPRTSDPMWVITAVKARVDPKKTSLGDSEAISEAATDLPFSIGVSEVTSESDTHAASSSSQTPDVKRTSTFIVEE